MQEDLRPRRASLRAGRVAPGVGAGPAGAAESVAACAINRTTSRVMGQGAWSHGLAERAVKTCRLKVILAAPLTGFCKAAFT